MGPSGLNVTVCSINFLRSRTLVTTLNKQLFDSFDRAQLFPLTFWFIFPFRFDSKVPSESKPFKPENMLLLFFSLFTPASVRSHWASNIEAATNPDDLVEKGILFNEISKILLSVTLEWNF